MPAASVSVLFARSHPAAPNLFAALGLAQGGTCAPALIVVLVAVCSFAALGDSPVLTAAMGRAVAPARQRLPDRSP
jgi:hypothetical protein